MDILIKGLELPTEERISLSIYPNGIVVNHSTLKPEKTRTMAIELPSHEETDLDLYDYIKQGSSFIKLDKIASELSFLIHCFKDKKIGDSNVLGRLVAMRNAIWDSVTLEANDG